MRVALLLTTLLLVPAWAGGSGFTAEEEARYQTMINQLRCLVCQNQTIAESNAPLAQDLRGQVESMMRAGRTDDEILRYLTERYGDFVLYRPPVKPSTWLLWAGPFLLLILGVSIAILVLRPAQKEKASPEPKADADALRSILKDEDS